MAVLIIVVRIRESIVYIVLQSTILSGYVDFSTVLDMGPSEKSGLMDKIFAFPGLSYTILLLLTTENIEVGSWKKQLASIESS